MKVLFLPISDCTSDELEAVESAAEAIFDADTYVNISHGAELSNGTLYRLWYEDEQGAVVMRSLGGGTFCSNPRPRSWARCRRAAVIEDATEAPSGGDPDPNGGEADISLPLFKSQKRESFVDGFSREAVKSNRRMRCRATSEASLS